MLNKSDKIIVVGLFLLLGLWIWYTTSHSRKAAAPDATPPVETAVEKPAEPAPKPAEPPPPAPATPSGEFAALTAAPPVVLLTKDGSRLTIDPELGGITGIELPEFKVTKGGAANVVIGRPEHPLLAVRDAAEKQTFSHAKLLEQTPARLKIVRQLTHSGVLLEQEWRLTADYPRVDYRLTLRNPGTAAVKLTGLQVDAGFMEPLDMPAGFFGAAGIDQQLQYLAATETKTDYETLAGLQKLVENPAKRTKLATTRLQWLAVQNKFFTTVLAGEGMAGAAFALPLVAPDKHDEKDKRAPRHLSGLANLGDQLLAAGESRSLQFDFYAGPKRFDRLQEMGQRKEQIMQFGLFLFWHFGPMEWISRGINWLILTLLAWVTNYGLAIILATLIIRGVFWPVTHMSMVWSERMKALQPHMQTLREKYKSDPQLFNQKMMELYREHKVNPFAGCLPLLFQIPVFFALFNVLRNAIAARHAGFLWVADLSLPDTVFSLPAFLPLLGGLGFNILPLLMGGAMLVQQKLMPTSADPMQEKIMIFMSLFMIVVCYSMPAGLTLYWTVSNVFTIGQYQIIHAWMKHRRPAPTAATASGKRKA